MRTEADAAVTEAAAAVTEVAETTARDYARRPGRPRTAIHASDSQAVPTSISILTMSLPIARCMPSGLISKGSSGSRAGNRWNRARNKVYSSRSPWTDVWPASLLRCDERLLVYAACTWSRLCSIEALADRRSVQPCISISPPRSPPPHPTQ